MTNSIPLSHCSSDSARGSRNQSRARSIQRRVFCSPLLEGRQRDGKISNTQQKENFALWREIITTDRKQRMAGIARLNGKPRKITGALRAKRRMEEAGGRPAP